MASEQLVRRLVVRGHHSYAVVREHSGLERVDPEHIGVQIGVQQECARHLHDGSVLALCDGVPLRRVDWRAGDLHAAALQHCFCLVVLLAAVGVEVLEVAACLDLRPVVVSDDMVRRMFVRQHLRSQMPSEHVRHHGDVEFLGHHGSVCLRRLDSDRSDGIGYGLVVWRCCQVPHLLAECGALHLGLHAGVTVGDEELVRRVFLVDGQAFCCLVFDQLVELPSAKMSVKSVRADRRCGDQSCGGAGFCG